MKERRIGILRRDMQEEVQEQVQRTRDADTREIIPKFSGAGGTLLDRRNHEIVQLQADLAESALAVAHLKNRLHEGVNQGEDADGADAPPFQHDGDEAIEAPGPRSSSSPHVPYSCQRPRSPEFCVRPNRYVWGVVKCVSQRSQGVFVHAGLPRDAFLHFGKVCATIIKPSDLSDMFSPGDWVEATVEQVASDGKIYLTMRSRKRRLSPKVCAAIAHNQRRVEPQHRQAYERRRW